MEVRQNQANSDKVKVTFNPPAGDEFTKHMIVPKDPSHETEFTALLRTVGRNYDTAEGIIGERVPANYTDDGWEINYEEPDMSVRERARETVHERFDVHGFLYGCAVATTLLLWPVAAPISISVMAKDKESTVDPSGAFLTYLLGLAMWGSLLALVLSPFFA